MSQCDRVLEALSDGEWKTSAELYDAVGGYMVLHSRISDLRIKRGLAIEGENVPGASGAAGYRYRLVSPLEDPSAQACRGAGGLGSSSGVTFPGVARLSLLGESDSSPVCGTALTDGQPAPQVPGSAPSDLSGAAGQS